MSENPVFLEPSTQLNFTDQYAFRPTGSTTAALIAILQSVTEMLSCNSYVVVIALDFSKAFDSVRHSTLLHKMASTNTPDEVYNWLVNFFSNRRHCTKFCGTMSGELDITANNARICYWPSILCNQCSRPHHCYCRESDADDTYIVIPAADVNSR